MSKTTKETRRASYEDTLPKVKDRARLILETLGKREMTVNEITAELVASGIIPYFNRNYVAPRMTELKDMNVVETCGRRKSALSERTEAVWRKKMPERCCGTCHWNGSWSDRGVCTNRESENVANYTDAEGLCGHWQPKKGTQP